MNPPSIQASLFETNTGDAASPMPVDENPSQPPLISRDPTGRVGPVGALFDTFVDPFLKKDEAPMMPGESASTLHSPDEKAENPMIQTPSADAPAEQEKNNEEKRTPLEPQSHLARDPGSPGASWGSPGFRPSPGPQFSGTPGGFRPGGDRSTGFQRGFPNNQRGFHRDPKPDPRVSSQARAELEALFSGTSPDAGTSPRSTVIHPMQGRSGPVEVTIKRRKFGPDGQPLPQEAQDSDLALVKMVQDGLAASQDASQAKEEGAAPRVFLVPPEAKPPVVEPFEEKQEGDPFAELALVKEGKLPPHVKPIDEPIDLKSVRARLELMGPDQALAWLLLTPEHELKPISLEESRQLIAERLQRVGVEEFHALKPVSHWIAEPSAQILRYNDGQLRRAPLSGNPVNLPGQLGIWVSANKFLGAENLKRSANAQRINEISLAGLVMACNRFEAMEWMVAGRISPIRPAALLGCAPDFKGTGHEIGLINGYALAMLAHSNQFFNWAMQWQPALNEEQRTRTQELSAALSLALKTWSASHGELSQACAEMTAVMLQMGAQISEWGLQAFSHNGKKSQSSNKTAVAWSRFCAQTFSIDRKGLAAQRVMESAKIQGYKLTPSAGEPQAMMPYAQSNAFEAIGVFIRHGFPVDLPDAIGETVLSRARSSQAHRVVSMIEAYLQGRAIARDIEEDERFSWESDEAIARGPSMHALLDEQALLEKLLWSMRKTSSDIRELDHWLGIAEGHAPQATESVCEPA